jgi:energy-coupling factor transport system ATP-binding protein
MGIQFKNLNFFYNQKEKKYVLKNINLKISEKNEFIALIGKIGSGKSSLVQLMNGLLLPSEGNIKIFDHKINNKTSPAKLTYIRKNVGLVFQFPEYQLFETTVLKDVMFAPKNFSKNHLEAKNQAIKSLKELGISEEFFDVSPFKLSGGQQKKVAIAGILAMNPKILILDEPTRGLDFKNQKEIMNILKKKNDKDKKTIIFITHDIDLVAQYANKIIFLQDGEIIFFGSKNDFFTKNNLNKLGFEEPQTFRILKFLNKKMNINFKPKYNLENILKYLTKISKENKNLNEK